MSEIEEVGIVKDGREVELPPVLANLLIKHRGWELADESDAEVLEEAVPTPVFSPGMVGRGVTAEASVEEAVAEVAEPVIIEEIPKAEAGAEVVETPAEFDEATCDDDLPDGITFAESAYETVIDEKTGEQIRVLKTHCRNGHEYHGNVKIRVRGDQAYRECQQCLKARRARASEKEKAVRVAKAPAKKAPAKKAAK